MEALGSGKSQNLSQVNMHHGKENPWHQKGGFSESWMHFCILLAVIVLLNTILSYMYDGTWDIYFTCFGLYLFMVAAMLVYIHSMKKDQILLHKSSVLYPENTWIENISGSPILRCTFSLGNSLQKNASFLIEIPVRTIRHLYFHPDRNMLYVDGDFLCVRTDQPDKPGTTWNGAWLSLPESGSTEFFATLHQFSSLSYESVRG